MACPELHHSLADLQHQSAGALACEGMWLWRWRAELLPEGGSVKMGIRVSSRQLSMSIPSRFQGRVRGRFKVTCPSRQLNESKSKTEGIA